MSFPQTLLRAVHAVYRKRPTGRAVSALVPALYPHLALLLILLTACVAILVAQRQLLLLEGAEEAAFVGSALDSLDYYDDPVYEALTDQFGDHEAAERSPAYKVLSRLVVKIAVSVDKDTVPIRPNPYLRQYDLTGSANQNTLIYPLTAGGVAAAVRWLRLLSLVAMLATAVSAYIVTLWLTDNRSSASLVAAACALLPGSLIMAATANADALTAAIAALLLLVSVRIWRGPLTLAQAIVCGAAPALGALVSPTLRAIDLLPLVVLAATARETPDKSARVKMWQGVVLAAGLYVIVKALVNTVTIPAEPLVLRFAQAAAGAHAQTLASLVLRFSQTFWGLLDWRSVPLDRIIYTTLGALAFLSAGGLGLALVRLFWHDRPLGVRHGWWITVLYALFAAMRFVWMLLRNNGLLIEGLPALLAPGTILLGLGWAEWLPQRARWVACGVLSAILLAVSLVLPEADQRNNPSAPLNLSYLEDEDITPVGIAFGDDLYLVGYDADADSVARGEVLTVRLTWLARRHPSDDYTVSVAITGRQQMQVGIADSMPGGGQLPTSSWVPGQIIQDEIAVPISPRANTPSKGEIRVTVYRGAKEASLEAHAPDGASLGNSPRIGDVRLVSPNEVRYEPLAPMQVDFSDNVRLFGFSVSPVQPQLGAKWTIDLYWQALAPLRQDYTVFAHLVNAYGRLLAQTDEQPLQGDYPTSLWQEGEQVYDTHVLQVPERMEGEPFYLLVGLYNPETGERLTYTAADGTLSDHVTLGPLLPTEP